MVQTSVRETNTLDLFLTHCLNLVTRLEAILGLSDHEAAFIKMQLHVKTRFPRRPIYVYCKEDRDLLKASAPRMSERIISSYDDSSNTEEI